LLSREDYADYAIKNCLAISSDMLHMHPGLRNCKSVSEASQLRKEIEASVLGATDKAFHAFSFEMKEKSRLAQRDRYISSESGFFLRQIRVILGYSFPSTRELIVRL
jgi:hypothetical protein